MSKAKLNRSVFLNAMCFSDPFASSSTSTKLWTTRGAADLRCAARTIGSDSSPSLDMIIARNEHFSPPMAIIPCGTDDR